MAGRNSIEGSDRQARETAGSRNIGEPLGDEMLFSILCDAPYGLIVVDREGVCRYANRTFTRMTGYALDDIETLTAWFKHAHPNPTYRQKVENEWQDLLSLRRNATVASVVCRDGKLRDIEFRLTTLENGHSLLALRDVSEQMMVEELLRQATSELTAVIDAFPDVFLRLNADGTVIGCRVGSVTDPPFAPQEMLGRRIQDLLPAEMGGAISGALLRAFESGMSGLLEFSLEPRGRHYEVRVVPLHERHLVAIIRDITKRREAEAELHCYREGLEALVRERTAELEQTNRQLQRLLYYVEMTERRAAGEWLGFSAERGTQAAYPDDGGMITTDESGRVVLVSTAAESLTGYTSRDMNGRPIWAIITLDGHAGAPPEQLFSIVLEQGKILESTGTVLVTGDAGSQRRICFRAEPIRDRADTVIGMICTVREV